MTPVRDSDTMQRDGFMTIPFPAELCERMTQHIHGHIRQATDIPITENAPVEELTRAVARLSDDGFVEQFRKPLRMFPHELGGAVAEWIGSLAGFLGGSRSGINYISPAEHDANPTLQATSHDVFWRCVRPGKPDVGQAHADFQFWEINRGTPLDPPSPFPYDERWKIWLPLLGCDATNSLEVLKGSHREDIPLESIQTKYGTKPAIRMDWLAANEHRFFCPLPQFHHHCVLFHDKLVHRGPANATSHLRISGELTILLKL